ncbi:MAG: hypothetical protein AAF788_01310 [Pseudomonadota bacterium]
MRPIATLMAVLMSLALAGPAFAKTTFPKTTAEEAFRASIASINSGDFQQASRFYSRDKAFVWVENGELQFESAEEATAGLRGLSPPAFPQHSE